MLFFWLYNTHGSKLYTYDVSKNGEGEIQVDKKTLNNIEVIVENTFDVIKPSELMDRKDKHSFNIGEMYTIHFFKEGVLLLVILSYINQNPTNYEHLSSKIISEAKRLKLTGKKIFTRRGPKKKLEDYVDSVLTKENESMIDDSFEKADKQPIPERPLPDIEWTQSGVTSNLPDRAELEPSKSVGAPTEATAEFEPKDDTNGHNWKILMVGIAKAGKTSIQRQFFENIGLEEISKIKPTVNRLRLLYDGQFLEQPFNFWDLGGQAHYRKLHLRDRLLFTNVRSVIYVIDLQDDSSDDVVFSYLQQILEGLNQENKPYISIFLHKYDPAMKQELMLKAFRWSRRLKTILNGFSYSFHLTSVFDDSARQSLAQTIFISLPQSFIHQALEQNYVMASVERLHKIYQSRKKKLEKGSSLEDVKHELSQTSVLFGQEIANNMIRHWLKALAGKEPNAEGTKKKSCQAQISIQPKTNHVILQMICETSLSSKNQEMVEPIVMGVFQGLGNIIGLGKAGLQTLDLEQKRGKIGIEVIYSSDTVVFWYG